MPLGIGGIPWVPPLFLIKKKKIGQADENRLSDL